MRRSSRDDDSSRRDRDRDRGRDRERERDRDRDRHRDRGDRDRDRRSGLSSHDKLARSSAVRTSLRSRVPLGGSRPLGSSRVVSSGARPGAFGGSLAQRLQLRVPVVPNFGAPRRNLVPLPRAGALLGNFRDIARRVRGTQQVAARRPPPPRFVPEATLAEKELRCGGRAGPIAPPAQRSSKNGVWQCMLNDTRRRSFVSYKRDAFKPEELDKWWKDLTTKLKWEQPMVGERRLPRSAAWLTTTDCSCTYKYGGTSWNALKMEPWFMDITKRVCEECGVTELPNCCNANLYKDGTHTVGWHSDNEPLFAATRKDALIISLSLGAGRLFQYHPNEQPGQVSELSLEDGDLCTMEGLMQKHYKHRVPTEGNIDLARINLTWRWIVRHDADCPLCHTNEELPPETAPARSLLAGITAGVPKKRSKSEELRDAEEEVKKKFRAERFGAPAAQGPCSLKEAQDSARDLIKKASDITELSLKERDDAAVRRITEMAAEVAKVALRLAAATAGADSVSGISSSSSSAPAVGAAPLALPPVPKRSAEEEERLAKRAKRFAEPSTEAGGGTQKSPEVKAATEDGAVKVKEEVKKEEVKDEVKEEVKEEIKEEITEAAGQEKSVGGLREIMEKNRKRAERFQSAGSPKADEAPKAEEATDEESKRKKRSARFGT
eukprot:TRINITY_DN5559_c0_g1_i1.p1 TRINITY_DN5559_c0_g1~~TRINITY_DN5559_c0_g1_i1.p1  ORF type:complete len:664 (+),score=145.80 TRINITY_DN5559_c0_g1_i1:132-2123(+)